MMSGFGMFANRRLVTVFTAPRYGGEVIDILLLSFITNLSFQMNRGAVMTISRDGTIGFRVMTPVDDSVDSPYEDPDPTLMGPNVTWYSPSLPPPSINFHRTPNNKNIFASVTVHWNRFLWAIWLQIDWNEGTTRSKGHSPLQIITILKNVSTEPKNAQLRKSAKRQSYLRLP